MDRREVHKKQTQILIFVAPQHNFYLFFSFRIIINHSFSPSFPTECAVTYLTKCKLLWIFFFSLCRPFSKSKKCIYISSLDTDILLLSVCCDCNRCRLSYSFRINALEYENCSARHPFIHLVH